MKAWDNSPYSCCTAGGGYANPTTGVFGPNEIGDFGDNDRAWGISGFSRDHAIVVSAFLRLRVGFSLSAFWKSQSGRPWTPVGDGDLNGDGLRFNDRIFVFDPADLPLASSGMEAEAERELYRSILDENSCVGNFVRRIIDRNTCRMPWRHQLNIRLTKSFGTVRGHRAELMIDFFNVLNGIGRLLCTEDTDGDGVTDADLTRGVCGLGRVTGVFGSNRELLEPQRYDPNTSRILYEVESGFGEEDLLGANLLLQFQLQIGFRYFF